MRACYWIYRSLLSSALALAAPMALSQAGSPGLKAAVDAAWQRSPQGRTLDARRDEMLAGREAAQTWFAGSPTVGLSQRSDRWTDRNGVRETEVSVAAQIWLPDQRAARTFLAQSSSEELEAQIANARLALAGEVRERLWAVAAAHEALSEAEDHQHHLKAIAGEVLRRVGAGDLARTDGMLAQQEVLAARGAVAAAQAKLQEALGRYRTLTGQQDIPALEVEPIAGNMAEPHPRLAAAHTSLQRSQASFQVVSRTRGDPPTVGISMRREQDNFASPAGRSIGIAVQIPFGTAARNRPLESAARTQIETATAEAAQAEAMLKAETELAQQQLDAARQALEAASARVALARQHTELIEKAFKAGERGLADLLRSQALSHEADTAQRQQKVALGLAHARLNQALGILP